MSGLRARNLVTPYHVGRWRIDTRSRAMTDGSTERRLSPRAMRLLETLAGAAGEVVDRATLLDAVWPDVTVGDESLTQAVAELRRAFGDRDTIETVSRAGYRLKETVLEEVEDCDLARFGGWDTFDFDAYRLCLEARAMVVRGDRGALENSEALTREAAEMAPGFAQARAEYALMAVQRHLYGAGSEDRLPAAIEHAKAAARLRPDLAGGYTALGYALGAAENWAEAKRAFGRAIAIDPSDADTHYWAGRTMYSAGEFRTAAALGERAATLDPGNVRYPYLASRAAGVFDAKRSRRSAEIAFRCIDARLDVDPGEDRARMARGPLLAQLGRTDAAVASLEADPADGSPLEFYSAAAWAMVGDTGRSLEALERVTENGWRHPAWLRAEPALARISMTPRFARVARQLGAA